jgi:hypothetical protein
LTFAPDPLIYVYNLDFKYQEAFGELPNNFKNNYVETQNYGEASKRWEEDYKNYGYNDWIYANETDQLLFRTVKSSGSNKHSILQIYNFEQVLLAELKVPTRFRVVGKIGKKYVADGIIDEELSQLGYYTFIL